MEHYDLKNLSLALYRSLMEEPEFRGTLTRERRPGLSQGKRDGSSGTGELGEEEETPGYDPAGQGSLLGTRRESMPLRETGLFLFSRTNAIRMRTSRSWPPPSGEPRVGSTGLRVAQCADYRLGDGGCEGVESVSGEGGVPGALWDGGTASEGSCESRGSGPCLYAWER